jgi:hypothetical protein
MTILTGRRGVGPKAVPAGGMNSIGMVPAAINIEYDALIDRARAGKKLTRAEHARLRLLEVAGAPAAGV